MRHFRAVLLVALCFPWIALPVWAQDSPVKAATPTTLETLAERIDAHIAQPRFANAAWGVKVVSLDSGRTLYAHNADTLMLPASTGKLYTAALALDSLGPDYRIPTSLFATDEIRRDGELRGDLILIGYGDPTLGANPKKKWADQLASALRKAGVKTVRGELVADATGFAAPRYGHGWEAADLQSWFGAPASALSVNENVYRVEVRPAAQPGAMARIASIPDAPDLEVANQLRTLKAPAQTDINLIREPGSATLHAFGGIASNASPHYFRVSMHDPALVAAEQLREALEKQGIKVRGKTRSIYWPETRESSDKLIRIADVWSEPLAEIVHHGLKVSQNLYMQNLLLMVGAKAAVEAREASPLPLPFRSTEDYGIRALRNFLNRIGVPADGALIEDGAGLSRRNLTSPSALAGLLLQLGRDPNASAFRLALPEAGVDGSLTGRMRDSAAEGQVHAKTGSMAYTYALAGYAITRAKERLAFAFMINNYRRPRNSGRGSAELDAIAVMLAELDVRSAP